VICPYCEHAFEPHHVSQVYCSALCRGRSGGLRNYANKIARRGPLPVRQVHGTCGQCQQGFTYVYRPGRKPKFCPQCFSTMKPYSRGPRKCDGAAA